MSRGQIRKALSGFYYVDTGGETLTCRARGKFRQSGMSPLVGDWVEVRETEPGRGMVWEIEPRRSVFDRPAVANVDQLVVVASLATPVTDPYLIDRVDAIAALKGCDVVVCVNKVDLADGGPLADIYRRAGLPTVCTSAETGEGITELISLIFGKLSAFTGNSGVGKSSILNAIEPGFSLRVDAVSEKLGRGKHTTRHVELLQLLRGGGAGAGAEGASAGVLCGVPAIFGQMPVCGVQPHPGEGLRGASSGAGRRDPRQPPPELSASLPGAEGPEGLERQSRPESCVQK